MTFTRLQRIPKPTVRAHRDDLAVVADRASKLFPQRLKMMRARADMTQTELAKRIFVAQHTVSNWEKSLHQPKLLDIVLMAEVLDCSTDYLLGRHVDP